MATAKQCGTSGLYRTFQLPSELRFTASTSTKTADLWNQRLVHASKNVLNTVPKMTTGIRSISRTLSPWHLFNLGKAQKKSFESLFKEVNFAGEIVHFDVVGPLLSSIEGHHYFRTFLDQFSRDTHVACLLSKKDASSTFSAHSSLPDIQKCFSKGIGRQNTDGSTEYKPIKAVFKTSTTLYTLQRNPFGQRINLIILDPARYILEEAGLGRKY